MQAASPFFSLGNVPLEVADPVMFDLVEQEKLRQLTGLEMIASENLTSLAVLQANGSVLTNKYSEGLPGARYYGGNEIIDQVESLCQQRALAAFGLDPSEWGVNVQPYSGSPANFAVYTALLKPHDRIMGLDLPSGGHLTHGYYTAKKKVSATSVYLESLPYKVKPDTGIIDYDEMESLANLFMPKMLIGGASAYCRDWDIQRMRKIADGVGAKLMFDMAHISGLVAAKELANPFDFCDVVTTTTHKYLRGPRSGIIFFRKKLIPLASGAKSEDVERAAQAFAAADMERAINEAVFPGCQGGPHNNVIAAVATALLQVAQPEFKQYAIQVKKNAKAFGAALISRGMNIATGGTDNHIVLLDLRNKGLTGSKVDFVLEHVNISANKNTVPGDVSALNPSGVRFGTCALTSRGMTEAHMDVVASFIERCVQISVDTQTKSGKQLKDFKAAILQSPEVAALRAEVDAFARTFFLPGVDIASMRYTAPKGH